MTINPILPTQLQLAVAQLDASAPPPTEVRLFPFGDVKTRKGDLTFTPKSAARILAAWKEYGRQFGFDYEHGAFDKSVPPKDRVASGWGDLEVRGDGLWVVNISWTPDAAKKIAAKEFRYLSAALLHNAAGLIVGVENCALTNMPATLDAEPLVLSALPVAGLPPPSHLPAAQTTASHKRRLMSDNTQGGDAAQADKHKALAKQLCTRMSSLLSTAQACSESEHPGLKKLGADIAGDMPEHIEGVRMSFPDMGEGDDEGDERKEMSATVALVERVTGQKGAAARGALLALAHNAKTGGGKDEKAEFVDKLIKVTRQATPSQRTELLALSMEELQGYAKGARRMGPREADEAEPRTPFVPSGKPEDKKAAAQVEAIQLSALSAIGLDPKDPRLAAAPLAQTPRQLVARLGTQAVAALREAPAGHDDDENEE